MAWALLLLYAECRRACARARFLTANSVPGRNVCPKPRGQSPPAQRALVNPREGIFVQPCECISAEGV